MVRLIDKADFDELTALAMSSPGHAHMRPVIQKELLHYDILYCLDNAGLLDRLTFQGGASLRLCHGSPRYSEDLDFVGGEDFSRRRLGPIKDCIERYIGRRYGLEVSVREPGDLRGDREYADLKIDKWQVTVTTDPGHSDIPRQRVKIEVASLNAYSREPRAVQLNYEFLPEGYGDTIVLTESLDEVMADKLVSLVNTTGYVRNRDIWDLRWLKRQGAQPRTEWVRNKVRDYRVDNYGEKLALMLERLPEIIQGDVFQREISRFIPLEVEERTLGKSKFKQLLTVEVSDLLERTRLAI